MARRLLFALVGATTLLLPVTFAASAPPTRIPFEFDETFQSGFLTNQCGFPVIAHQVGTGTTTLFYDNTGTVVREFDTLRLTTTYSSPDSGKSFTEVIRAPAIFLYPEGNDVGDSAILIILGVQRTSGPGSPRNVGREVFEAVIVGMSPEGVPITDIVSSISQTGQFDVAAVAQARCALLSDT